MLGRMQHFVNGFIAQCRKHDLAAELILVEWNPPPDRPPLEEALEWPADFGPATVRIVTVPPDVHARFPHATALPLFQMIGKNVGIRRARGRYVLATNIDILLDDATVLYLRDRLTPGIMLRIDRYDVPGNLANEVSFDQILAECRARCFQVNTRFGILDVQQRRILGMGDGVEARLLALYNEIRIFGFADTVSRIARRAVRDLFEGTKAFGRSLASGRLAWRLTLARMAKGLAGVVHLFFSAALNAPAFCRRNFPKLWPLKTMPGRGYWYIRRALRRAKASIVPMLPRPLRRVLSALRWLLRKFANLPRIMASSGRSFAKAWRLMGPFGSSRSRAPAERRLARSQRLHTNACGDFTLLAREDWLRLRGYPEWPIFSWHIDSVFMFAANAHELRHILLGPTCRIFHIDHSRGSGWTLDGAAQLFARLDSKGIPYLRNEDVSHLQECFAADPAAAITNDVNWGLIDVTLAEREIDPVMVQNSRRDKGAVDTRRGFERQNLNAASAS